MAAMASFLVEAYLPATASLDEVERRVTRAADDLCRDGSSVRLVRSIYVAEDETCFLLFDAGSLDEVRMASDRAQLAAQRIVEAFEASGTGAEPARSPPDGRSAVARLRHRRTGGGASRRHRRRRDPRPRLGPGPHRPGPLDGPVGPPRAHPRGARPHQRLARPPRRVGYRRRAPRRLHVRRRLLLGPRPDGRALGPPRAVALAARPRCARGRRSLRPHRRPRRPADARCGGAGDPPATRRAHGGARP